MYEVYGATVGVFDIFWSFFWLGGEKMVEGR